MVYMIAEKGIGRRKIISVVLAIIALLVLVLLVGDFSHYQLFTAGLSILAVTGGILLLLLIWHIVRPNVVVDHDGKRFYSPLIQTESHRLRDIDMVFSRRFSWEVFQITTGTLYIVTRNRGIVKIRNVKEVDQAKMRLIILINNYKQLFRESD